MIKSLYDAQITDGLPRILADQEWVRALSKALSTVHQKTMEFAVHSQIYTAIDTVPEIVLDALAVNLKIDWYRTGCSIEEKRRIVKTAIDVRRRMGTAYAVRMQADAIYQGTAVEEWFQYNGTPGCFRVSVNTGEKGLTLEDLDQIAQGIENCKNVRSHLDRISIDYETKNTAVCAAYTVTSEVIEIWPEPAQEN